MIQFFAKHPTAANLLMVIMLAAGILSLGGLRKETLPDASPVEVEVRVAFPGATSQEVDETIIQRLEDALDGTRGLKEMRSVAQQSVGTTTLEMLDNGDYNAFRNEIDNSVSSIDDFPDDTEPPITMRLNTRQPVLDVLVTGPMNAVSLKAYAEGLRERLTANPEVSRVDIDGFSDHLLRVELSRSEMLRYGLSPTEVSNAIARQSLDLPAGKIEGDETIMVRVEESRKSKRALESLVVKGNAGGAEIKLSDIATVRDEFELEEDRVSIKGQRGLTLKVLKSKTEDTLKVADAIKLTLEEERLRHPQVSLTVVNDSSDLVQSRISLLVKNGLQGCVLVFLVMWIFFNAKLSFWVVFSLPVSFLAAFALVPVTGLTINMLTMVGLLMALGILMDDGIVIAENIARRRQQGDSAMTAAVEGVREVAGGVFSSFLTTCCVLGPLIFLSGDIGRILRVLPMMLLLVLAASLVEAFLILPAHLGHSLTDDSQAKNRVRQFVEKAIDGATNAVGSVVAWTIRWRYLTAGLVVMIFLMTISLVLGGFVRGSVFPSLEGDTIVARILMPPGTPFERTEQVVADLERSLAETNESFRSRQPENTDLIETTFVRFNQNADALESGPHVATIQAELLSNEVRDGRITEIVQVWRDINGEVPDALAISFDEPQLGPSGRNIEVELSGLPLDQLDLLSGKIQNYLKSFKGVYNINDDLRRGESEMLVKLKPGATGAGVTTLDLARQLRGSFQGLLSDQIQVGNEEYDVEVRFADSDRDSVEDLENYLVSLPGGKTIPLREIASIGYRKGWSRIARIDKRQVVNVYASVDSEVSNSAAVIAELQTVKMPELAEANPDLDYRFRGEAEKGKETGSSMAIAAMIGCLGVFVILSFQFRSYVEPIIVMVAIPFALVGVILGHWIFGISLSLPSFMGYASLAGIVVNDSILLVLFLKSARQSGQSPIDSGIAATKTRFRAVMITSLTTVAGLMPLLLERSMQAQILIPIAISICFGLMASTILVLLVIPPFYVILNDFGLATAVDRSS
jgi:multidrug efflux pump subunit AcrB